MLNKVNTLKKQKSSKKGFTLVELVIVIAVLAIIAAIAIPTVSNVIKNANNSSDKSNCQAVELALKTAYSEVEAGNAPTGYTTGTTVTKVLTDNGITVDSTTKLPKIKSSTGYSWKYVNGTGKIYVCEAEVSGTAAALTGGTSLSDIFETTSTTP